MGEGLEQRIATAEKRNKARTPGGKLGDCIACKLLCTFGEGELYTVLPAAEGLVVICNECTKKSRLVLEVLDAPEGVRSFVL